MYIYLRVCVRVRVCVRWLMKGTQGQVSPSGLLRCSETGLEQSSTSFPVCQLSCFSVSALSINALLMFPSSFSFLSCHSLFLLCLFIFHVFLFFSSPSLGFSRSLSTSFLFWLSISVSVSLYHLLTHLLFSWLYQVMQLQQQLREAGRRDKRG